MFEPFKKRNLGFKGIISILIFTFIVGLLAYKSSNDQWKVWTSNPDITFYKGSPLLSTADGPYFLDIAKSLNEDTPISLLNERRFYPEFDKEFAHKQKIDSINEPSVFNTPLLPTIINLFSKFYDNNLLLAANSIIPVAAFLTAIFISLFFFVLGFGYEGLVAGLGASLSQSIYVRTSIGRVDTDLLNIGFFYSILGLIAASVQSNNFRHKILLTILAGVSNFCFIWWYQRPGFFLPFLFTLVLLQLLNKAKIKTLIIQILIFSFFSGPFFVYISFENILSFIGVYINFLPKEVASSGLIFPDTFNTITELQKLTFSDYSKIIFGENKEWITVMGIIGLVTFMIFNFRISIAMLPPFIFLLMSIFLGKRFAIYAIPLYWFGVAYLVFSLILMTKNTLKLSVYINLKNSVIENILMSVSACLLLFIIVNTSISDCENDRFFNCKPKYTPMPSFSNKITQAFDEFKYEDFEKSSIIVTWWDFGYWLNYFSGLSSVHDGGTQRSPKTYLVAKSLTSTKQQHSYDLINYLVSSDLKKIQDDSSKDYEFFMNQISKSENINRPVYVFLSREMIGWWSTITYIGNWDIINGKEKNKVLFERIDCKPKSQNEMICGNAILNINSGSISNGNQLDSLVISQNGNQIRRYDYKKRRAEVSLLIEIVGNERFFYVVSPETLESNFSKLFLLNISKNKFFTLVKDEYPAYRVFKVN